MDYTCRVDLGFNSRKNAVTRKSLLEVTDLPQEDHGHPSDEPFNWPRSRNG